MDVKSLIFYSFPWGYPTKFVVAFQGNVYEIREGHGFSFQENYGATVFTDEELEQYGSQLLETDKENEKTCELILEAIGGVK
jgi:hypothetical protein